MAVVWYGLLVPIVAVCALLGSLLMLHAMFALFGKRRATSEPLAPKPEVGVVLEQHLQTPPATLLPLPQKQLGKSLAWASLTCQVSARATAPTTLLFSANGHAQAGQVTGVLGECNVAVPSYCWTGTALFNLVKGQ